MENGGRWAPVAQEVVQQDLRTMLRGAVRAGLELFLEQELEELIGAEWYARVDGRRDHRNGRYGRQVLTSLGRIDVAVPRARYGQAPRAVLTRYRRRSPDVDALLTSAYVHGVSTRQAGELTTALLGERVSRATVSRVTQALEATVAHLRGGRIEGPHPYLFLDATFVDARWARAVENVSALVAYAVGPDGKRRLLAITIGPEESEASWADLLQQLLQRGLSGVQLVIADAHQGLAAAVRRFLPEAKRQRCTVHLARNVLAQVPHRLRARVAREVTALFQAASLAAAKTGLARFTSRWGKDLPEAVRCLRDGFPAATAYFAFPPAHWRRIRTTNGVERLHGEIKRRTRAVGAFPDRASALRLITAVAVKATLRWGERQYLDVALLAPGLPAAA